MPQRVVRACWQPALLLLLVAISAACSERAVTLTPLPSVTGEGPEVSESDLDAGSSAAAVADERSLAIKPILEDLRGLPFPAFLEASFGQLTLRDPEIITAAGVADAFGIRDDQLNDLSAEFLIGTQDLQRGVLDILRSYDPEQLSAEQQISWRVYEWYLEDLVRGHEFMYYDYPLHHFIGSYHDELVRLLTEFQPMQDAEDARDYISRLNQVNRQVDQLLDGLRIRRELEIIPPDFILAMARGQLLNFLGLRASGPSTVQARSNPLYRAFEDKLAGIPELSDAEREALHEDALNAVEGSVIPGYLKLLAHIEDLQQEAGHEAGVGRFPRGDEYYTYMLRKETSTEMSAQEIHALGLSEVDRIQAEMREVYRGLGYPPDQDLSQLFRRARTEAGFISVATAAGDREVIATYTSLLENMSDLLEPAFDRLPQARVEVVGDPWFNGGGYYTAPSADGARPGHFHTGVGGSQVWRYGMPTLAYHEAIPGHHFQIALAQELELPTFQRHVTFNGFVEGWALYAERLAKELGAYESDPYGDLGRLQFELLRAVRLVVDTGIHAMGWSREEAKLYMNEALGDPSGGFSSEVDRYVVLPAQATGYKVGMLTILELRRVAKEELGESFDLRDFHNLILGNGSLPLEVLEDLVLQHIES